MKVKNYLLGYKNMFIMQDTELFNFSLDSVLLANFVTINKSIKKILDIGTGNAPIPLILTTRTAAHITAIEIQKASYDLAIETVMINNLEKQIEIINDDINNYYYNQESDIHDVITCNPPFFKNCNLGNNNNKILARHEKTLSLPQLFKVAKKLLKNKGVIAIVNRPERLIEIIQIMKENNIEPKKIQLVYPFINKEANILLIEGMKNGKMGLKILPPIYTHNLDGSYTEEIKKMFQEECNENTK